MKNDIFNFYLDMDGVLVLYGINDYTGQNPVWLRKNTHYFRNLKPDKKMLTFTDMLYRLCQDTHSKLYILTSLRSDNAIFNEHFHDKILWLRDWCPYINIDEILISVTTKRDAVEYISGHSINTHDILIDDYNKNLTQWCSAGGTAVKYCNGINNPNSFDGYKFEENLCPDEMLNLIKDIMIQSN